MLNASGQNKGLRLLLNSEQYEYMTDLSETRGVKVSVHNQNQFTGGRYKQFIVGPGQHTFVEVHQTEVQGLIEHKVKCSSKERSTQKQFFPCYFTG